ncbi:MAG: dockerin type I repeat-containing protein, partial [Oscillospiraceae bacterium]|nr:dockerin type I repeat-containing protein [Oscillospiraceae bacterium]
TVTAAGHTEGKEVVENEVAATCTVDGSYDTVVYCSVCDAELSRVPTKVPAAGHTIVKVEAKAPTCTEAGYEAYEYCTECDYTTYVEIPAAHKMVDVEAKEATCTEDGYTAHKACSECDYTVGKEVIAAGHTIAQGDAQTKTCEQDGWEAYEYCTECDYTTKVVIPAGHTIAQGEAQTKTCTQDGWAAYEYCTECDYTTKEVIPAGHNYVDGKCDACGEADPDAFAPDIGNGSTIVAPDENGTVTVKAGNTSIVVNAPEGGWKIGENTFTVSSTNDVACVVLVKTGDSYKVLSATTDENSIHSFTATLDADSEIVVAMKGDIDGNGRLSATEVTQIKYAQLRKGSLDTLQTHIADVDGNGRLSATEVTQIKYAQLRKGSLSW